MKEVTASQLKNWIEKSTKLYLNSFPENNPRKTPGHDRQIEVIRCQRNINWGVKWYLKALSGKKIAFRYVMKFDFKNGNFPYSTTEI